MGQVAGGVGVNWDELRTWSLSLDHRDVGDYANRWADDERDESMPTSVGEWRSSLSIAFAAGQRWTTRGATRHRVDCEDPACVDCWEQAEGL